jgi:hypothetical protein
LVLLRKKGRMGSTSSRGSCRVEEHFRFGSSIQDPVQASGERERREGRRKGEEAKERLWEGRERRN